MRENLHVLDLGKMLLDMTLKVWSIRGKVDKLDFIKIQNCVLRKRLKTMKRQANFISDKGLVSKIYKELSKENNPILKVGKRFIKEKYHWQISTLKDA